MSKLEIYRRVDRKWAWRLRADNGYIVATDGGQGYENKDHCETLGIAVTTGAYSNAQVVEEV